MNKVGKVKTGKLIKITVIFYVLFLNLNILGTKRQAKALSSSSESDEWQAYNPYVWEQATKKKKTSLPNTSSTCGGNYEYLFTFFDGCFVKIFFFLSHRREENCGCILQHQSWRLHKLFQSPWRCCR